MKHITAAETKIVQGTFRGTQKVTHYYDPITRLWAAVGENGEFVAGWQLSEAQLRYLEKAGNIQ